MANTTWFNLRNQIIKEIVEKAEPFISAENYKKIKNIEWFNLPNTLNKIQTVLKEELEGCVEVKPDKIIWFNLPKKVKILSDLVAQLEDCQEGEEIVYDFDVTADWSIDNGNGSVNNEASFILFLQNLGASSVEIEAFDLTEGRLQAKMSVEGVGILELSQQEVTEVIKISGFDSELTQVYLQDNLIEEFNPTLIQDSITYLGLDGNSIAVFDPILSEFIEDIGLNSNQIVEYNPTNLYPNLKYLKLRYNQIVAFNPDNVLPTDLILLELRNNLMTTAGYTTSEEWANTQPSFVNCTARFTGNVNSVTGTNLATILTGKNTTIVA